MTITPVQEGRHITLSIDGRVDSTTAPQLESEILKAFTSADTLTLDFERVGYISSAGLRALLIGQKTAASKRAAMELIHVSEQVFSILKMVGFDQVLRIQK